jgi:transcription-repair coupling factor (superfamily II helicase)
VAVGFDLYTRLLDEAIRQIQGDETEPDIEPELQVSATAYIPETYVPDPDQKMAFYQRLGEVRQTVEVLAIEEELADRYGAIPDETSALLDTIFVKLLARQLRLSRLQVNQNMTLVFAPDRTLGRKDVEEMVTKSPVPLQFFLEDLPRIEVELDGKGSMERLRSAKNVLQSLV